MAAFVAWRYLSFNLPATHTIKRHFYEVSAASGSAVLILMATAFVQYKVSELFSAASTQSTPLPPPTLVAHSLPSQQHPAPSGIVLESEQDLIANVGDRVFFDFNSASLRPETVQTLNREAEWLIAYPNVSILVSGNTDSEGGSTTDSDLSERVNLVLGMKRADAIRVYLIAKGVDATRMNTVSYGSECPIAPDNVSGSTGLNRNAIISVDGQNPLKCDINSNSSLPNKSDGSGSPYTLDLQ
jgi:peptidoglycan-associated lipoprotein